MKAAKRVWLAPLLAVAIAAMAVAVGQNQVLAGSRAAAIPEPAISSTDLGGLVSSSKGPEAGVWVIAETGDLPTKFAKIVVTDDQGRYVIPNLPTANYKVWVRGYGLIDSKPVQGTPGKALDLNALVAPSPLAAAQYYPADYWLSLLKVPPKSAFPMEKSGIQTQAQWIDAIKGNMQLIQLGDKATREIPEALGKFQTSSEAWEALLKNGETPINPGRLDPKVLGSVMADWTDRIAAGELPPAPSRPQGLERNLVITEWDWSDAKGFLHDDIATDKRNPSVNANGLIYGLEQFSADVIDVLDPNSGKTSRISVPVRDPNMPESIRGGAPLTWGQENVRPGVASLHSPMMDGKGRLWITAQFRGKSAQPDFCKAGSTLPSAQFYPLNRNFTAGDQNGREVEVYDPETKKFTMIDTCFGTHHLEFAGDANNTLWFSGGENVVGWINTKVFDETGDAARAQGWCPYILDTNGNGKVDAYVGPDQPVDPTKDKRIGGGGPGQPDYVNTYGMAVNPIDGSIWETNFSFPGAILRVDPGTNPPYTCKTEIFNAPPGAYRAKGIDIDRNTGIVWVTFATSSTLAAFDRRKCKILNGPTATGNHCPEGWTLYTTPGPKFKGLDAEDAQINSDWHYLEWIDQFDVFGLGSNVPIVPGSNSDSVVAFQPNTRKFLTFRVPYPIGFYSRGVDGRVDDPSAGWKGKALWSTYATYMPWHMEGGKGQQAKVVKLQLRPNPLAR